MSKAAVTTSPERTHVERKTIASRNAYPVGLRQWGMLLTVYDDPTPANNETYQLVRGLSSTAKSDNGNWEIFTGSGGGGGSATTKKVQEFVADGVVDNWDISNGTLDQIDFVVVGGMIQAPSAITIAGQNVDVGFVPAVGTTIEVHYFQDLSVGSPSEGTVIFIGDYDASSDLLPGEVGSTGYTGTGSGGAPEKGNKWRISPGSAEPGLYPEGTIIMALQDNPTLPSHYDFKF